MVPRSRPARTFVIPKQRRDCRQQRGRAHPASAANGAVDFSLGWDGGGGQCVAAHFQLLGSGNAGR